VRVSTGGSKRTEVSREGRHKKRSATKDPCGREGQTLHAGGNWVNGRLWLTKEKCPKFAEALPLSQK